MYIATDKPLNYEGMLLSPAEIAKLPDTMVGIETHIHSSLSGKHVFRAKDTNVFYIQKKLAEMTPFPIITEHVFPQSNGGYDFDAPRDTAYDHIRDFWVKRKAKYPTASIDLEEKMGGMLRSAELLIVPDKVAEQSYGFPAEVNIHDVSKEQYDALCELCKSGDIKELSGYIHDENVPHALNHLAYYNSPFGPLHTPSQTQIEALVELFDVVELNYTRSLAENQLVIKLAEAKRKGLVAGGDSHTGNPILGTYATGGDFREFWEHVVNADAILLEPTFPVLFNHMKKEFLTSLKLGRTLPANVVREFEGEIHEPEKLERLHGYKRMIAKHPVLRVPYLLWENARYQISGTKRFHEYFAEDTKRAETLWDTLFKDLHRDKHS